jgi:hypothetical protein
MKRQNTDIASAINPDSVLVMDERGASETRTEDESALLALVDGKRTVAEILQVSRMSGFVAMRRLRALLERKVIRPAGRSAPPVQRTDSPQKGARLGLTQDLTSAAEAFAARAQGARIPTPAAVRPEPRLEPRAAAPAPTAAPQKPAAPVLKPDLAKPLPTGDRSTPLQGSVALPSVIIAFGPDFLDGRRSPTRRLGSADIQLPPPAPRPVTNAPPPGPQAKTIEVSTSTALVPSSPADRAIAPAGATTVMPRAQGRRRRGTPHTTAEIQAQELWLSVTKRDWHTLAIVATSNDGAALSVASGLVEAGTLLRGKPVELFVPDGSELSVSGEWTWNGRASRPINLPTGGLPPATDKFERVLVLEPLASSARSVALAQTAEAVLLVAESGQTDLKAAKRTVDMIGRNRFVGCVFLGDR